MTLTDHLRLIDNLVCNVVTYVENNEYEKAHCALDDIEKKVRQAHRHIDHLQNVTDFCARPAEGD